LTARVVIDTNYGMQEAAAMKRWLTMLFVLSLALMLFPTLAAANGPYVQGEITSKTLWAGQHMDAGTVTVGIDGSDLCVTFDTDSGWLMLETHLYIGPAAPTRSAPGRFPYSHEDLGGTDSDQYCIALSEIGAGCGGTVYIAAHAELVKIGGTGCGSPQWASNVVSYDQGTLVGGGPITDASRSDPDEALGAPDVTFYSLGFVSNGDGYVVVEFDHPVFNGPGDDIVIYEVTFGRPGYPDEELDVYAMSGGTPYFAGTVSNHDSSDGRSTVAIPSSLMCVDAVKLVDATDPALFGSRPNADGFDLDAVGACYLCEGDETGWAEGTEIRPNRNWAMYFSVTIPCD